MAISALRFVSLPACQLSSAISISVVLSVATLSLLPYCQCQGSSLVFTQPEEQSIGHLVGSVSKYQNILNMVGEDDRSSLRYSILADSSNSHLFSIDAISGNISFAKRVDREDVCPFANPCELTFRVAVSGNRSFFTTVPVKINITDINDNSPSFPSPGVMEVHISEAASENTTLVLTPASDADSSLEFGVQSYTLERTSDKFIVKVTRNFVGTPHVSLVLIDKLDREVLDTYKLRVVARDGGSPAKSATLTVNVVVDDVNDNDPRFTETHYSVNVSEEAGPGYTITIVTAKDSDTKENGQVVYELNSVLPGSSANVQEKISVDSVTGAVTLKQQLISGEYRFLIDARDMGNPPLFDQAVVTVRVMDTINNQPIVKLNPVHIDNLPSNSVSEGSGVNTVVAVLNVDDPDSGINGSVTCESLEPHFQLQLLEPKRYKVMVAKSLDRESNVNLTVRVICKDQGTPSLNATDSFLLNVLDVNDNSPVFEKSAYVQSVSENNLKDSTVIVVKASDKDDGQNAVFEYRLVSAGGDFKIMPDSGVIKANRRFDREENDQYTFQVISVDRGHPPLTGTTTVTVNIIDVNDVAPVFSHDSYSFQVYENKDTNSIVGNVSVTDLDIGNGSIISLTLKPVIEDDDVPFMISPEGRLSSLDKFDREERDQYKFYIVATDHGSPKLSSSAQVVVQILDVNDIRPAFVFPSDQNFTAYVTVPVRQDVPILQAQVYDADEKQNGVLTYSIAATNSSDLFRIGLFTGQVFANIDLSSSVSGTYFLTINVTDQGVPALWEVRNLYLVLQSKDALDNDVLIKQNVLIVSCIVCFTVIVSGIVLVTICAVRRHDQRKIPHNQISLFADKRPDNEQEGVEDSQQVENGDKDVNNHIPYHHYQRHLHVYNNSSTTARSLGQGSNLTAPVVTSEQAGLASLSSSQGNQMTESRPQKHEDYHSTSSAETVAVDSGHGSDEDMSSSMEQASYSLVDNYKLVDLPVPWNQRRLGGSGRSAPTTPQHHHPVQNNSRLTTSQQQLLQHPHGHLAQQPQRLTNPHTVAGHSSMRSNPRVAAVYQERHSVRTQPTQFTSSSKTSTVKPPQQPTTTTTLIMPFQRGHQLHSTSHRELPRQTTLSMLPPHHSKSNLPLHPTPQRQVSFLSQSSVGDDNSDLNTTTSGSYSVTSEDAAKQYSLTDVRVRDMYV